MIQNLDSILVQCHPLFTKANAQLRNSEVPQEALEHTFKQALNVEHFFSRWNINHASFWMALPVGLIGQSVAKVTSCLYRWPGPVHAYLNGISLIPE